MSVRNYGILSEAMKLYTDALRLLVKERLTSTFGESWWPTGVEPALTQDQKKNLEVALLQERKADLSEYLDAGHLQRIIARNHSAAFREVFSDYDGAIKRLKDVATARNRWAHPPTGDVSPTDVQAALVSMRRILADARLPEAVEVERLLGLLEEEQETRAAVTTVAVNSQSEATMNTEEVFAADALGAGALWRSLQDFLSLDVAAQTLDPQKGRDRLRLTVRVTNVAPSGSSWPEVVFTNLSLETRGIDGRSSQSSGNLGALEAGKSITREFELDASAAASIEFDLKGQVDADRFLRVGRTSLAPLEFTRPIAMRYLEALEELRVADTLQAALAAIGHLGPHTTLAEVTTLKESMSAIHTHINEKSSRLQQQWQNLRLREHTPLGDHATSVMRFFMNQDKACDELVKAMTSASQEEIALAIKGLKDLQVEAVRLKEGMLDLARAFQVP